MFQLTIVFQPLRHHLVVYGASQLLSPCISIPKIWIVPMTVFHRLCERDSAEQQAADPWRTVLACKLLSDEWNFSRSWLHVEIDAGWRSFYPYKMGIKISGHSPADAVVIKPYLCFLHILFERCLVNPFRET